jgi:hypothetical protein
LFSAHPVNDKFATAAQINLYAAKDKIIGYLSFYEDWVDIVENRITNDDGAVLVGFPISKYPYVMIY